MAATMLASVLTEPGRVEPRTVEVPSIGPDELLVRVAATGICGSDVATFAGTHPYKRAPVVLGHELSGTVERTGDRVTRFAPGDRVCAASFSHCDACEACAKGAVHLCTAKRPLSHRGWQGSFAEYVVLAENMTFALSERVDHRAGALVEPLSIGLHAVKLAGPAAGGAAATILGSGSIGLSCLIAARRYGYRVACVDVRAAAGELALRFGAEAYLDAGEGPLGERVAEALGGPSDVTIVANGHPTALADAAEVTRPGGTIVVVTYFGAPHTADLNAFVVAEFTVRFSALSTLDDFAEVIGWLERGEVDPRPLITDTYRLEDAAAAMRVMTDGAGRGGKVMLEVAGA